MDSEMKSVRIQTAQSRLSAVKRQVESVIVGKAEIIELLLTAMIAGGHVLIEDVPGVGKTQLAMALARSCGGSFGRIQMTPDIMPSDVTGFELLHRDTGEMEFRRGAVFCNFLLADEINRSSPKSQSALLEAMEEKQVSYDGKTYELPKPFMVLATQNPVETYGTYALPEAQMDRFLMKLHLGYPDARQEREIVRRGPGQAGELDAVLSPEEILELRELSGEIYCSEDVEDYLVRLVRASREEEGIRLGVSPRGSIALHKAGQGLALLKGRDHILPDDIQQLAPHVLGHRLMLSAKGKALWKDGKEAVEALLSSVSVLSSGV